MSLSQSQRVKRLEDYLTYGKPAANQELRPPNEKVTSTRRESHVPDLKPVERTTNDNNNENTLEESAITNLDLDPEIDDEGRSCDPNSNNNLELNPNIQQYRELTLATAKNAFDVTTKFKDNLTKAERTTLNKLKKRKDIVIKKADKGDTIVVETLEQYTQDGLHHLNNPDIYLPILDDINPEITRSINKFLKDALDKGLIDYDIYENIKPSKDPRTPIIYFLKKLHKNP